MDRANDNMIIGKRKTPSEIGKRETTIPSCYDGQMTKSFRNSQIAVGWRNLVVTWIPLRLLTSHIL